VTLLDAQQPPPPMRVACGCGAGVVAAMAVSGTTCCCVLADGAVCVWDLAREGDAACVWALQPSRQSAAQPTPFVGSSHAMFLARQAVVVAAYNSLLLCSW
jgi:hypothetical protein